MGTAGSASLRKCGPPYNWIFAVGVSLGVSAGLTRMGRGRTLSADPQDCRAVDAIMFQRLQGLIGLGQGELLGRGV